MIFAMTIKFGISIYGNILITYTSEKYPTVVRSIGYGISITSGKICTIIYINICLHILIKVTIFVPLIVVWV